MNDKAPTRKLAAPVPLMLASLGLAFFTWYAISGAISFELQLDELPIQVVPNEGWSVLDLSSETVDVRFRGAVNDMRSLRAEDVKVVVDVRGRESRGVLEVPIDLGFIGAPNGARPVSVRPTTVTLELDRESERTVPVKVDQLGEPPAGYEVEEVICKPAAVTLRGPMQDLEELEEVQTLPVDLSDKVRSFSSRIGIQAPDGSRSYRIEPEKVTVEITLVERSATTRLEAIPVSCLMKPGATMKVDLLPDMVDITLKGQPELLKSLGPGAVRAYIDCSNMTEPGEYELPVRVDVPALVTVDLIDPKTIQVTLLSRAVTTPDVDRTDTGL